jgi:hypothetical protein
MTSLDRRWTNPSRLRAALLALLVLAGCTPAATPGANPAFPDQNGAKAEHGGGDGGGGGGSGM